METILALERQRARDIAEEYRGKGYEVIEEPLPEQLPDFLSSYRPDLLKTLRSEIWHDCFTLSPAGTLNWL
jgi:hypothetical protein